MREIAISLLFGVLALEFGVLYCLLKEKRKQRHRENDALIELARNLKSQGYDVAVYGNEESLEEIKEKRK